MLLSFRKFVINTFVKLLHAILFCFFYNIFIYKNYIQNMFF